MRLTLSNLSTRTHQSDACFPGLFCLVWGMPFSKKSGFRTTSIGGFINLGLNHQVVPKFQYLLLHVPLIQKTTPNNEKHPLRFRTSSFSPLLFFFFFWLWISLTTLGENPCLRTYGLTNIISKTKKQKKLQTNSEPSPRTLMLFLSHCTFTFFFLFTFVVSDCNTTKYQPVLCSVLLSVGFIFLLVGLVAIF